jgi:hypothetical protein
VTGEPFDPETAPPLMLVKEGDAALELRGAEGVIGAGMGEHITTWNNRFVSHQHLRWRRVAQDAIVVWDLGSKNGTWLGTEPLGPQPR